MEKPKNLCAVLFDYDGVIADTLEDNFRAWHHALLQHNIVLVKDEFLLYESMRPIELAHAVCQEYGLPGEKATSIVLAKEDYFIKHCMPRIYDGVKYLLKQLKKRHIKLGLVSVGSKTRIYKTTPQTIISQFDVVVAGEQIRRPKPDPQPYKKGLSKLHVLPACAIVVEDSPIGIQSAKAAGIYCIAIASTRPKEFLQEADVIVNSISEIARIVVGKAPRKTG